MLCVNELFTYLSIAHSSLFDGQICAKGQFLTSCIPFTLSRWIDASGICMGGCNKLYNYGEQSK